MSSKWKAGVVPQKFILVTSRKVTRAEKCILGRTYKTIIEYDPDLHGVLDLSKVAFDMLIINGFPPENHRFLEIVKQKLPELAILPIVLKNGTASRMLASELDAALISRIEDLQGADLLSFLTKTRLTKLQPKWKRFLLGCFRLASSA